MASSDELSKQLKLIQQMNAAMQQIAGSQRAVEQAVAGQAEQAKRLVQLLQQVQGLNLDEKFKSLGSVLTDAAEKAGKFDDSPLKNVTKGAEDASDQFETLAQKLSKAGKGAGIMGAAMAGLRKGFSNFLALSRSTLGFLGGIVEWLGSVAAAIVAIPLRILEGLVNLAASSSLGMQELRREIEAVRKQFGDLRGPGSAAILVATKTLQGFADTGLRAWRIFGTLAERLGYFRELTTAMGATFSVLSQEFKDNGGALAAFDKGLGVGGESMKALAARSIVYGKTLTKTLLDVSRQSLALGKQFGLDQKLIARDMAKASVDVRHFGTATVKEIGVAATYARKLGVELDKITGTLDAFETFDTAAENAAKLSQAFGVQVDAFKLMEAQNPADQIDMLRKQFRAAGVDASQFNRQQLRLLESTTGLDAATAQQVFSQKNFGVSLDDVRKQSESAEKQQLTQAEAMSKLADSIERMVKDGPALQGSFFRMFIDGFLRGIQVTREFRTLMLNIRESLRTTMRIGVQFGRAFVAGFDGVKDALGGLAELFDPKKFRAVGDFMKPVFEGLLAGTKTFDQFMDETQMVFGLFIDSERGPLGRALDGFKRFFIKLADLAGDGIKWVGEKVGKFLEIVADYITGKKKLGNVDLSEGDRFLLRVFKPIFEGFESAWTSIKPSAVRMLSALGDKLIELLTSPQAKELGYKVAPYVAAIVFGPAVVNALVYAGTTALLSGLSSAFLGAAKGVGAAGILGTAAKFLGAAAAPILAAIDVSSSFDKFRADVTKEFGDTNGTIGVGFAGLINAATLGLLPDRWEKGLATGVAAVGQAIDGLVQRSLFRPVWDGMKTSAAKTYEFVDFFGKSLKNVGGSLSDAFRGSRGERSLSVEDAKKRASDGFFGSVLRIGEDFGNDLADRVMGDRDKALKKISKGIEDGAKRSAQSPTVPAVTAPPLSGDAKLSDAALSSVGDRMQETARQIAKAQQHIAKIKEQAPKLAKAIGEGGVKTALTAVRDVVAMVQELDDALARTPKIDVATKLSALAQGAGLGSKASYIVSSKPVQINLNLEVTMNAGEVEKVIVMRKESIIRDRLEFATIKAPGQQGNNSLPETFTANVPNIAKR